ncbi:MogA/MoaB family molybdenum cofactor biosynthesis protein [Thalassobacillus pellis]|uniref:MogA/MoaB family molybdenum cofactor biosynthesis protein n=1 Tax=Thalassobacillus pellis TaxID=748008 RepID=UPI001961765F|nr:molybdenum cofactor biosynthesis protein B [Thalassobacillus pellis]MBM7554959.1 molybdenum cofactor biosynthesis protein B [Thalassobacillus pellis]
MAVEHHKHEAAKEVKCLVITVSDTRNEKTDKSGKLMIDFLEGEGHRVTGYKIVRDVQEEIRRTVVSGCQSEEVDAVLINGGTGIAKRDVTIETVASLLEKEIVGFGELFRMLSYTEDIGSAAILSRAVAGVSEDTAVFSTPGSSGAVRLAMKKLILPELGHVVREIKKDM